MTPAILACPRFNDSLDRCSPWIQERAVAETHEFVRRHEADPRTVIQRYDRVAHLGAAPVLELELGGACRLLAAWSPGRLTLLDVGRHEVVAAYHREWLARDLAAAAPAGAAFTPGLYRVDRLLRTIPDRARETFASEEAPEWVYYLTDTQRGFVASIRKGVKRSSRQRPAIYFVVGGPGTGKTTILAKLLLDLSFDGHKPCLVVTDGVGAYLESGGGLSLRHARMSLAQALGIQDRTQGTQPPDVILVDDPATVADIDHLGATAPGRYRAMVIAFDPCQLEPSADEDLTDDLYEVMVEALGVRAYTLKDCYRQKENVGRQAKVVMDHVAASTPFLAKAKIEEFRGQHATLYNLANDLRFPNKHGYLEVYEPQATERDARREASRLRVGPLWRHSPPLLLVLDQQSVAADWPWGEILRGIRHTTVELSDQVYGGLVAVKGLEYQHAILALSRPLYRELVDGFTGSGQARYHRRRLLRIPFSRAKDSMVTFVTEAHG